MRNIMNKIQKYQFPLLTLIMALCFSVSAPSSPAAQPASLYEMVETGSAREVSRFLRQRPKPDVNERGDYGLTPLHLAAFRNKDAGVVKVLIKARADITARDDGFWTPLHRAVSLNENPDVGEAIIRAGAKTNVRDKLHAWTPLHSASAHNSNAKVVAMLVKEGADIQARGAGGRTPLHANAMLGKNPEIADILIKNGAYVNVRDAWGSTPLDLARQHSDPEIGQQIIAILERAGAEAGNAAQ